MAIIKPNLKDKMVCIFSVYIIDIKYQSVSSYFIVDQNKL